MTESLIYLTLTFAAINVLASILIFSELQKRKVEVNFLLIRLFMIKYVNQYKSITIEESGTPGLLYYMWMVSVMAMGLSAVGLIIAAKFL
jgi:hypothetical protein